MDTAALVAPSATDQDQPKPEHDPARKLVSEVQAKATVFTAVDKLLEFGKPPIATASRIASQVWEAIKNFPPQRQVFVLEYVKTGNAVRSYLTAYPNCTSYSGASADSSNILERKEYRNAVRIVQQAIASQHVADLLEKRETLTGVMRGTRKLRTIVEGPKGTTVTTMDPDPVPAIRELNEMDGHHAPRKVDMRQLAVFRLVDDLGDPPQAPADEANQR